ncbi:MAG: hypothetical protein HY062_13680 [Bacteroidetes bacterium]|nr:hypothetical protein [Bacteroidota bacterium]
MIRRNFLKLIAIGSVSFIVPFKVFSANFLQPTFIVYKDAIQKIVEIITGLKKEGSSITRKTLNHKKYVKDSSVHYPNEDSIEDLETHCQVFFHAHRDDEYGHFHTFINNKNAELVHLIMISMDKKGNPTAISTVNDWVTGDFKVETNELKELFNQFKMNHDLFPDQRIIEFIENIFIGYKDLIFELFDERDQFIKSYFKQNASEPFDDSDIEILSSRAIDVYSDIKKA